MTQAFVTARPGIRGVLGAGALAFGALAGCETKITDKDIKFITAGELRQMMDVRQSGRPDHLFLIDPRSAREYAEGHITGAEHITIDRVISEKSPRNPPFNRYSTIVVYGNDPGSAPAKGMAKRIMSLGHRKNTKMYAGGMKEWGQTYPALIEKTAEEAK